MDIVGITGTLSNSFFVSAVVADITSGCTGLGLAPYRSPRTRVVTLTPASPITRSSAACTSAAVEVGTMRQLMFAVAVCGSALSACPAASRVATQVVRSIDA